MEHETSKQMTMLNLIDSTSTLINGYMYIYDEYYKTGSRDSAFLKDLVDSLIGITAVIDTYATNKEIHPEYALEKLKSSKSYIDSCIAYYENKLKSMQDNSQS